MCKPDSKCRIAVDFYWEIRPGALKSNGQLDVALMVRLWNSTLSGRHVDGTCDTRGLTFISEPNFKAGAYTRPLFSSS
jgi:hypothetical protein